MIADWDNADRPSNWKEIRDKWAECPRQFRMLQAPYCYRYWRYFANLDPWYGRSISVNSQSDWYPTVGLPGQSQKSTNNSTHRRSKNRF
jgi:hypothetical protein